MKELAKAKNDAELAKVLGVSASALSNFKKEDRVPVELVVGFARDHHVSIDPFIYGEESWLSFNEGQGSGEGRVAYLAEPCAVEGDFLLVPMVQGRISAGGGLVPDTTTEMRVAFRKEWLQRKGDAGEMSVIKVQGDSMEPSLYNGDIVLVNHANKTVVSGAIYAIAVRDEIMIKRVHVAVPTGDLQIISDNKNYAPFTVAPAQLIINGKVIWFGRDLER